MSYVELTPTQNLLLECDGISKAYGKAIHYGRKPILFVVEKDVTVPKGKFIEIIATSTNGTIGELVDIEFNTQKRYTDKLKEVEAVDIYSLKYVIKIDGRKKPSKIIYYHAKILDDYTGPTQWVRNVKNRKDEVINNPVNKFKQTLNKDDWIIGVGQGYGANKPLMIGKVSRWTKHNVWVTTIDGDEFKINDMKQTFLLPGGDEYVDELTLAIVKGWNGR